MSEQIQKVFQTVGVWGAIGGILLIFVTSILAAIY